MFDHARFSHGPNPNLGADRALYPRSIILLVLTVTMYCAPDLAHNASPMALILVLALTMYCVQEMAYQRLSHVWSQWRTAAERVKYLEPTIGMCRSAYNASTRPDTVMA